MKKQLLHTTGIAQGQCAVKHLALAAILLAACLVTGCKSATVTGEHSYTATPAAKPAVIYITDFELGAQNIQHEDGIVSGNARLPGRVRGLISGASDDREARARQLVDLMSTSLVKNLTKAGFSAVRLRPGAALPAEGWLVRGVVTEVQEGNRLRRALIGFGEGATDLQVITGVDDLSQGSPKPLYELDTDANSGKTPGAGPTIALGPYGAAARFVMARQDLEKNVKETAVGIADYITKRVQGGK
jgi:hypothetical protein